ncbi:polyamine aminopropyltransferase [Burkholderia sp. TSV86]|uniref:polyamine aminopropyltransferase n=1 Tax=Burkholderia sp. TSV86 TaxID=1385594 RepID=UPI00075DAB4C|nr:polyamine aminopropyltransferase [Burkholderia sp. TSV86]KVE39770.1 spermidine synthase [Burkholderia sp. TSV86]
MSTALLFHPTPDTAYGFPNARRVARVASRYQTIEVWETAQLGLLFTLDGRPMTSVGDEFVYHECMTHPAALAHPSPRKALVLGGGDGGAARQLLKHRCIERIVIAELDPAVVDMARRYLADVHQGALDDPRVELVIGDAAHYVDHACEHFDLAVFDLTPPDSPAASLYTAEFYARLKRILTPRGAVSLHLGSPLFHQPRIATLVAGLRASFAVVTPLCAHVPLYGSPWLMAIASDTLDAASLFSHDIDERLAQRRIDGLRFYDAKLHPALFTLPRSLRDTLGMHR